jgi:hypothetical protein
MNKKLVYVPTINDKISSFAQALTEICNVFCLVLDFWATLYIAKKYLFNEFYRLILLFLLNNQKEENLLKYKSI